MLPMTNKQISNKIWKRVYTIKVRKEIADSVNAVTNAATAIGDIGDCLNRFVYDNDWGEKGLDGVHSIDDFLDEMEAI